MAVLAVGLWVGAAEPRAEAPSKHQVPINTNLNLALNAGQNSADPIWERPVENADSGDPAATQMAQFRVPSRREKIDVPQEGEAPAKPALPKALRFEYVRGFELEVPYSEDLDLDDRIKDKSVIFAPTVFGSVTYRPNSWLETRLELTFEQLFAAQEQDPLTLPDGTLQPADETPPSLLIDQLFARFALPAIGGSIPTKFTVGRVNFEDLRLSLYDAALDAAMFSFKPGDFNIDVSMSREDLADLDIIAHVPRTLTNNYIVFAEFRGIEDNKLAGYWILRDDLTGEEGRPQFMGLRATGRPTDAFSYWTDFSYVGGRDEKKKRLSGSAFDVGGVYRFLNAPLQPCIALGFAYGSGDNNSNDSQNTEHRQTGLESNEGRFCGVTQFAIYGEALTPELSNIKLFTVGAGFRPAPSVFVEFIYHHYRLSEIATEIRSQSLTAKMNQFGASKDVGDALDIILGFRNLFGVRGLGFEVRAGMFFPGDAWRRNDGTKPQNAVNALTVMFF